MSTEASTPPSPVAELLSDFTHDIDALQSALLSAMSMLTIDLDTKFRQFNDFSSRYGERDGEEESAAPSYRFPLRYGPEASRLAKRVRHAWRGVELVPRNFLVSLVSTFDAFLGRLLAALFRERPELLDSSDRTLTLSQLTALGSIDAAKGYVIDKEVEQMIRMSRSQQVKRLESKFGIKLEDERWPVFYELNERRHCIVHNDARITEQYIAVCRQEGIPLGPDIELGKRLEVPPSYFDEASACTFELGVKLAQVLWRKLIPSDLEQADVNLIAITYDLLCNERWTLAAKLLNFACQSLPRLASEQNRRILIVNRAQAYKWAGDNETCTSLLSEEDWTACGDDFAIAVAALRDDFASASELMRKIGPQGSVSRFFYETWPVFRVFRKSEEFLETFKSIFGVPFEDLEQVLRAEESEKVRALIEKLKKVGIHSADVPDRDAEAMLGAN